MTDVAAPEARNHVIFDLFGDTESVTAIQWNGDEDAGFAAVYAALGSCDLAQYGDLLSVLSNESPGNSVTVSPGQWIVARGDGSLLALDKEPARVVRREHQATPTLASGVRLQPRSLEKCEDLLSQDRARTEDFWETGDYDPVRDIVERETRDHYSSGATSAWRATAPGEGA